jgi:uncharacterized protein YjbI with pentapeptide repeats
LELTGASFRNRSSFSDLLVDGFFLSKGAKYGPVTFERAVVSKGAYFDAAKFFGEALFWGMQIKGQAVFTGARFHGRTLFIKTTFEQDAVFSAVQFAEEVAFDGSTVARDFAFIPDGTGLNTVFAREARFVSIEVKGQSLFQECFVDVAYFNGARFAAGATFQGAQFKSAAHFELIRCDGLLLFSPSRKGQHVTFEGPARFLYARIRDEANFRGAEFFENADFEGSQTDGNAILNSDGERCVRFLKDASFVAVRWAQAKFEGTQFMGEVAFDSAEIRGSASFNPDQLGRRVSFGGRASFLGAHVASQVSFDQAVFHNEALFLNARFDAEASFRGTLFMGDAHFDRIEIRAGAWFRADNEGIPVKFSGSVRFHGALVMGQLSFTSTLFEGDVSFDTMSVVGSIIFCPDQKTPAVPPRFKGSASFNGSRFSGDCSFRAAAFEKEAKFEHTHFGGPAKFLATESLPTTMSFQDVSFAGSTFESTASFSDIGFQGDAEFNNALLKRGVGFKNCHFENKASFRSVLATGDAIFNNASFEGDVSFRNAHFETFTFLAYQLSQAGSEAQLVGKVDLQGITYDRANIPWKLLFESLEPFNVQPYIQLERVLREAGEDREADMAYLDRRNRERGRLWSQGERARAVWSWLEKTLFRYGVRPYRLLILSLIVLVLGVLIFSRPGTVMYKHVQFQTAEPVQLSIWQSLFLSVSQFLPIPLESLWQPASTFALVYSIIHRVAGFILVPLGVAALAGLLHRRENK